MIMILKEVTCKSILNKSGICDYCINPYTGCGHACVYCYARFMKKYTNHKEEWGSFVDVKTNAVEVLKKQLKLKSKGSIFVSSVTDAYQPIEKRYHLTRSILKVLSKTNMRAVIQTKSALVLRDIDIISKAKNWEVGFTITCFNDDDRKNFEPNASSTQERLEALRTLKRNNIGTYAFIGPFLPFITEKDFDKMLKQLSKSCDYIMVDRLNTRYVDWQKIVGVVKTHYPEHLESYNNIFIRKNNNYYDNIKTKIKTLAQENGLRCEFCY